jgi:hypothetical protein
VNTAGLRSVASPIITDFHVLSDDSEEKDSEILEIFNEAMASIDEERYISYERARSGATPVYYSPNRKSVIKHSRSSSSSRLDNMTKARDICKEMNLVHITIPSAFHYNDFLIEQHVPISDDLSAPTQMQLYLDNRDKFTDVARELTRFFFNTRIGDLTDDEDRIKRDNVPLYLDPETGQGKVALIDLEEFRMADLSPFNELKIEDCPDEEDDDDDSGFPDIFKNCISQKAPITKLPINPILFKIFPAHLDEILEELEVKYPNIRNYREDFKAVSDKVLLTHEVSFIPL